METDFKELVGKTLSNVTGRVGDEAIIFTTIDGGRYKLYHEQN